MIRRLVLLAALTAALAGAQCVMCFRTASAQQTERARVLNAGVLVLGVPPFLILAGFCVLAWRRNRSYAAGPAPTDSYADPDR
jgi:hypothetical protein